MPSKVGHSLKLCNHCLAFVGEKLEVSTCFYPSNVSKLCSKCDRRIGYEELNCRYCMVKIRFSPAGKVQKGGGSLEKSEQPGAGVVFQTSQSFTAL